MSLQVHIRKKLGDFLLEADFDQEDGCMGILGASGCGKSMTLKCIAGIERPDAGRICLDGQVLFDSEKKINQKPQERQVGFLFQHYALFPTMTVEENIGCGVRERGRRKEIVRQQVERFQLKGLEKLRPAQLSGGQQQRTALARMLAGQPRLLLLDEPFSALDSFLRDQMHREMMEILREFSGKTLMVSHSREEIYKFCGTVTAMEQGRTLMTCGTREMFASPGLVSVARLTGLKNISPYRKIGKRQVLATDWNVKLQLPPDICGKARNSEKSPALAGQSEEMPERGFIGIRGHHIRPAVSDGETEEWNIYHPILEDVQEAPFEDIYLLRNAQGGDEKPLWWMRPRNSFSENTGKMLPDALYFAPKALMLLREARVVERKENGKNDGD